MDRSEVAEPGVRPETLLIALETTFSPPPNNDGSRRLPAAIQGELGSSPPVAACDQEPVAAAPGTMSRILRSAPGSFALEANPLNSDAMVGSTACETACGGCPRVWAISPTARLSTMFNNELNIEAAINVPSSNLGKFLLAIEMPIEPPLTYFPVTAVRHPRGLLQAVITLDSRLRAEADLVQPAAGPIRNRFAVRG